MKQNSKYFKLLLSGLCFAFFIFLAVASGEGNGGGGGGYTPTRIEENPEKDFSTDISEDEREEEEVYVSHTEEDFEEPSDSIIQEVPDSIY